MHSLAAKQKDYPLILYQKGRELNQPVSLVFSGLPQDEFRLDANNDGSSNLLEYQAGSDPLNPNSKPEQPESLQTKGGGGSVDLLWLLTLVMLIRSRSITS
ncbi:hypothetical protein [Paraglaciecola arctica]|uniref:hypothetical protein n=1 Tax=Paraglaciecola arctica TaxID=1128911 RepID=UPI001C06557E|nr:hypothetical protein [Paraglaciecola arctica]MBU3004154.1 hypothetical protein [Paraglaciecola arctica]